MRILFVEYAYGIYQQKVVSPLPVNRVPLHHLDYAVLNVALDLYEEEMGHEYHSVRGVFQESAATFAGSDIREKSTSRLPFAIHPAS